MTTRNSALNWFELYVSDFERAKRFYETILNAPFPVVPTTDCSATKDWTRMAMFPYDCMKGVGGAIVQMENAAPGAGGTVVYLNVEGDLDNVLKRIPTAGGTVVKPRLSIGEHGFIAIFKDTEGNVVGLHSMQ